MRASRAKTAARAGMRAKRASRAERAKSSPMTGLRARSARAALARSIARETRDTAGSRPREALAAVLREHTSNCARSLPGLSKNCLTRWQASPCLAHQRGFAALAANRGLNGTRGTPPRLAAAHVSSEARNCKNRECDFVLKLSKGLSQLERMRELTCYPRPLSKNRMVRFAQIYQTGSTSEQT